MTSNPTRHDLKRSAIGSQGQKMRPSGLRHSQDSCSAAREMMIEFGPEAADVALARADQSLDEGDGEGFQIWLDVAAAIQGFATRSDG